MTPQVCLKALNMAKSIVYLSMNRTKEYYKKYYAEHKEKRRQDSKNYRLRHPERNSISCRKWRNNHMKQRRNYECIYFGKIRKKVIEILGNKCVRCGINDIRVLQIDHIKPCGSKNRKNLHLIYKEILQNLNQKEYQLLCSNCNWIKKFENNENRGKL